MTKPPSDVWNFSRCPPAEEMACYFYEYLWEVGSIREAFSRWKTDVPAIDAAAEGVERTFQSSAHFEMWAKAMRSTRPAELVRLDGTMLYLLLLFGDQFPERHWLEIRQETRARLLPLLPVWSPVLDVSRVGNPERIGEMISAQCSMPWSGAEFCAIARARPEVVAELPVQYHAFLVNWRFGPARLKKEFELWVDRMASTHSDEKTKKVSEAGRNTPREWLKYLAASRLMKAAGDNSKCCADWSGGEWRGSGGNKSKRKNQTRGKHKPIYSGDRLDHWKDAVRRAGGHVERFRGLVGINVGARSDWLAGLNLRTAKTRRKKADDRGL